MHATAHSSAANLAYQSLQDSGDDTQAQTLGHHASYRKWLT